MLKRHDRLTLVRLTTSAPPLVDEASGRLPLHTVTLSVGGSYHDLAGYIGEIERTLPEAALERPARHATTAAAALTVRVQLLETTVRRGPNAAPGRPPTRP
ncbi:MAG: hypothetical protein MZW92_57960 [Comamonadaceae bacterium]|nr:hypothetical protein [Comamonadaceae bacterium]